MSTIEALEARFAQPWTARAGGWLPHAGAAGLAAMLVLSVGLTDGGYYGHVYTELTVLLSAMALLAIVGERRRPRASRAGLVTLGAMALLTAWVALSSYWATRGASTELEVRRCALYLVALAAVLVIVEPRRRRAFLFGLLGAVCAVGAVAIGIRAASGKPVDRLYGSLLEEPIGYPNALGVLVAMGALLAVGLASTLGGRQARAIRAAAPFLVLVLGLTGSRGGALALALGLVALVALAPAAGRRSLVTASASAIVIGGAAWAIVQWRGVEGATLVALALVMLGAGWLATGRSVRFGRRALAVVACTVVVGAVTLTILRTPSVSTSYRVDYWRAATAQAAEHPLLGSGAGGFYLSWQEHRSVDLGVRDAHSLYIETLSELGPLGLMLVLILMGTPAVMAVRRRGDSLAATAGAAFIAFAAHAAVDWDWEMPVVTLAGLACAGVLTATPHDSQGRDRTTGRRNA